MHFVFNYHKSILTVRHTFILVPATKVLRNYSFLAVSYHKFSSMVSESTVFCY